MSGLEATELHVSGYPLRLDRAYDPGTHMWVLALPDGGVRIGLDALTADTYGSLAQLVVDAPGTVVGRGEPFGSLEAAKFVGPLTAPVSGVLSAVNGALLDDPEIVLREPYDGGWLAELTPTADEEMLLVRNEVARAWFSKAVAEHRQKGLVAE